MDCSVKKIHSDYIEEQSIEIDVLANDTDVDGSDDASNFSLDSVSITGEGQGHIPEQIGQKLIFFFEERKRTVTSVQDIVH